MSSTNDYVFNDGMISYKEGKYEEALQKWNKLPIEKLTSDTLLYFLGMTALNLDQFNKSSTYLDMVIADSQSDFQQNAIWYKALIHLKLNEIVQARKQLKKLSHDPQADALLQELRESP